MITYKILEQTDNNGIKTTKIEFEYNGATHQVDIPHFRPKTEGEIEVGIINRINSEIAAIEANEISEAIQLEIGIEKEASIIQLAPSDDSTYVGYTIEELNQKLALLSAEYNIIQEKISQGQNNLTNNSADYDLVIAELVKRSE